MIPDLKTADFKVLFDFVIKGMEAQGGPAWDVNDGSCRFRTSDGKKCAVGLFIPDEEYSSEFEIGGVWGALKFLGIIHECHEVIIDLARYEFIRSMQTAHDTTASVFDGTAIVVNPAFLPDFKAKMSEVAEKYRVYD